MRNSWILTSPGRQAHAFRPVAHNNGTYCEEMTPGEILSKPENLGFGSTSPLFEGLKSLNANDTIQWLVLLICLFNI